jgi:hypothetical protein
MKNQVIFLLLLLLCITMASCDAVDEPEYYSTASEIGEFTITADVGIRYYDENGNDLIKTDNSKTWPLAYKKVLTSDSLAYYKSDNVHVTSDVFHYGDRHNAIISGNGTNKYEFYVCGDGSEKCITYIHVNGSVDKIEITYRYTIVDRKWYPEKIKMVYNNTVIWQKGIDYSEVAVTKANGETKVEIVSQNLQK